MGIYLLNISIDTADPNLEHIPEDLSFNDQESIVEFVVETIMGYEDTFEEYDDPDSEDHHKKSNIKIDLVLQFTVENNNSQLTFETQKQRFPDFDTPLTKGFYQLDTPPPEI